MKLVFVLMFSFSIFASGTKNSVDDESSGIKVKEKQLLEHPEIKKCAELVGVAKDKCIETNVSSLTDKQLDMLGKDFGMNSYDIKADKKSEQIRNFMSQKIKKLLQGTQKEDELVGYNKDKALDLKKYKAGDHNNYREIYKNQLGNNMMLEINGYCLEHFGFSSPLEVVSSYSYLSGKKLEAQDKLDQNGLQNLEVLNIIDASTISTGGTPSHISGGISGVAAKIQEHSKDANPKRELSDIKALKDALFKDKKSKGVLEAHQSFCQTIGIKLSCDIYKCRNNSYSVNSLQGKLCAKIGISKVANTDPKRDNGKIACGLVSRLESYKKTFGAIEDQADFLSKQKETGLGFNLQQRVADEISRKDFIDATTLSSKDLAMGVKDLKDSEKISEKFKEDCMQTPDDKKCVSAISSLNADDLEKVKEESETAIQIYKAKLNKLAQDNDPEKFKEFLKEKGLLEKYQTDIDKLSLAELADVITNDYKAKETSLVDSMAQKYKALTANPQTAGSTPTVTSQQVDDKAREIKDEREYIEAMYQYNNFASTFFSIKDEDTEKVSRFNYGKDKELKALQKDGSEEYENFSDLFNDNEEKGSSQSQDVNYDSIIDFVIGGDSTASN